MSICPRPLQIERICCSYYYICCYCSTSWTVGGIAYWFSIWRILDPCFSLSFIFSKHSNRLSDQFIFFTCIVLICWSTSRTIWYPCVSFWVISSWTFSRSILRRAFSSWVRPWFGILHFGISLIELKSGKRFLTGAPLFLTSWDVWSWNKILLIEWTFYIV